MVRIRGAGVVYRPYFLRRKEVLKGVFLEVARGEVAALVGSNGAGKTTLLRLILGLIAPVQGEVRTLGLDPTLHRPAIMRRVGVLLNAKRHFEPRWTPRDVLEFGAVAYGVKRAKKRIEELLERFRLREYERTYVAALSTGTYQRLALAFTLVHDPELWVLDEPTLGLDVESRKLLLDEIQAFKRQGKAVLLTSHDPSLVNQSFDRVFFIREGRVREEKGHGQDHYVRLRINAPGEGESHLVVRLEELGETIRRLREQGFEIKHLESVSVLEKGHDPVVPNAHQDQ